MASGEDLRLGFSLRELRERFGGDEGDVWDPWGNCHHVSLQPWLKADPDSAILEIGFVSGDDGSYHFYTPETPTEWGEVGGQPWRDPQDLVEIGLARTRILLMNEARDGSRRCIRNRETARQVLPTAHAAGVRHLAVEDMPATVADAGNSSRRFAQAAHGVLAQPDMVAFVQTALDLGWTLWTYELDGGRDVPPGELPTTSEGMSHTNQRQRGHAQNLAAVLDIIPAPEKLLVFCIGASAMKVGSPTGEAATMGWHLTRLVSEEPFVIDQTVTVVNPRKPLPDGEWRAGLVTRLRPTLESFGGTVGILRTEAADILATWPGTDAFVLSTDNSLE